MTGGVNAKKLYAARLLSRTGLSRVMLEGLGIRYGQAYIRAINYHGTPEKYCEYLNSQLEFFSRHFIPAGPTELGLILSGKVWPHSRPGLIITFDDGLRNNFDVAVPLLEKYGFVGWFMVPAGFIDCPPAEQQAYAVRHGIDASSQNLTERIAMSWDELLILNNHHMIGCHTHSHHRLNSVTPLSQFREEIFGSKKLLEERLDKTVEVFCWVGGEEDSYSVEAARCIKDAGYVWSFMTNSQPITTLTNPFQLQRTNIDATWPLEVVVFQLCGIMDFLYNRKRTRINHLTKV